MQHTVSPWTVYNYYTGRATKVTPYETIDISGIVVVFFPRQIDSASRGGIKPHIQQISLHYLVAFKNYNYLDLNVHFFKVNK